MLGIAIKSMVNKKPEMKYFALKDFQWNIFASIIVNNISVIGARMGIISDKIFEKGKLVITGRKTRAS